MLFLIKVRVWDLNPVLKDANWERRKDFCMFLSMLGYCKHPLEKEKGRRATAAVTAAAAEEGEVDTVVASNNQFGSSSSSCSSIKAEVIFCSAPLYRMIASYL